MAADTQNQHPSQITSPFDALRHEEEGRKYWLARELAKILEYTKQRGLCGQV